MTRRLCFIDFDGVLHPAGPTESELLRQLPEFEAWLRKHPSVEVVISSSWRHSHTLEQLRAIFSPDLRGRIVGVTGTHWKRVHAETGEVPLATPHERELEVLHWLRENGAADAVWAALDDEVGNFRPDCRNLIPCDPGTGLESEQFAQLEAVLRLENEGGSR
jgi:HAD domain in Swiss Army Knife RNA repair proteins